MCHRYWDCSITNIASATTATYRRWGGGAQAQGECGGTQAGEGAVGIAGAASYTGFEGGIRLTNRRVRSAVIARGTRVNSSSRQLVGRTELEVSIRDTGHIGKRRTDIAIRLSVEDEHPENHHNPQQDEKTQHL